MGRAARAERADVTGLLPIRKRKRKEKNKIKENRGLRHSRVPRVSRDQEYVSWSFLRAFNVAAAG